jgi:hypothetical protein
MMRTSDITPIINTKLIWHSISRLLWDSDLAASRFILAVAELIWAIILFIPGATFAQNVFPSLGFLPDYIWGFIFLFSCVIQISIILYEHMGTKFAKAFAMFNAFLWIYLVLSIIIDSYPPVIGVAGEITLMLTAIWICIRPYILAEGLYRAGIR